MKIVLFLGAGFSRAVGLPVMREFFGAVNQRADITDDEKQFVRELRRRAREGASMLEGENDNLEHILSFAMMDFTDGSEPPATKLKSILQRVYARIEQQKVDRMRDRLSQMLGVRPGRASNHELTVITTNYDLVAEFGMLRLGRRCRLGFPHESLAPRRPGADFMYEEDMRWPLLVKLHGSLNWFVRSEAGKPLRVEDSVVEVNGPTFESRHGGWYLPLMSAANFFKENGNLPASLIIPPTLYKQQHQSELESMWGLAHKALAEAERVFFIGYSFPDSDTYMKYFLAAALVKNVDLAKISIVAPDAKDIIDRLRKTHFGTHFKTMLTPIEGKWESEEFDVTA